MNNVCPNCSSHHVKDISVDRTQKTDRHGEIESIEDLSQCMSCHMIF